MVAERPAAPFPGPDAEGFGEMALVQVLRALVQMPGVPEVVHTTLGAARGLTGAQHAYLLTRGDDQTLRLEAVLGPESSIDGTVTLPVRGSLEGQAAREATAVVATDPEQGLGSRCLPGQWARVGALAAVPLVLRGTVMGVLACCREATVAFPPDQVRWLQHLADILAVALENSRLLGAEQRSRGQAEVLRQLAGFESHNISHYCQRAADAMTGALAVDEAHVLLLTFLQFIAECIGLVLHRAEVERERARAQARQEFLAIVSHELRTPLAVIKAYTEVLERRTASHVWEEQDDRVLASVAEQVDVMQAMVEQLLDLRRLDAGLMPLELSRFDLVALASRVAEVLQATTERHRVAVAEAEPVAVVADRQRARQVLTNLIENAIQYSPEGGDVTVTVQAVPAVDGQNDAAVVTVADHGSGISSDDIPKAFDRFYQGQFPPYRGRRSLGLGLYIAREIVTRHGGTMWVSSEPGHGSTFAFTLPLAGPAVDA